MEVAGGVECRLGVAVCAIPLRRAPSTSSGQSQGERGLGWGD